MKILCIADIHGDRWAVEKLKEFARENNFRNILILGDFPAHGNFHSLEDGKFVFDSLKNEFQLFIIPGNCDSKELIPLLDKLDINLHEKVKKIPKTNVKILGFGGSNITPFNTPFEFEEEEIYESLRKILLSNEVKNHKLILVTHAPPKNTKCDLTYYGTHAGSSAIRKIVEEFQPSLVLSSHVHESGSTQDEIGKTKIANIGKLSEGNIAILEINDTINFQQRRI